LISANLTDVRDIS